MKLTDISQCIEVNCEMLTENYERDFWMETFNKGKLISFVALWANKVIGYILCFPGMVVSFAVLTKYQGHGIGTALMKCVLSTHSGDITLNARVSNHLAVKLYQRLGFSIVNRVPNYYHSGTGHEDAYEMKASCNIIPISLPQKMNVNIV